MITMTKMRLDLYLFENDLTKSREKAKQLILDSKVLVNGQIVSKPSQAVTSMDIIKITKPLPYVSRGGLKLSKALKSFSVDVKGLDVLDVGASTGGFCDCLLQNGAEHVLCVDVGCNLLDESLKIDTRVKIFDNTNARYLTPKTLGCICDGAVCDASFISLTKLLPAISSCVKDRGFFIGLIKPQFEVGKGNLGKGGIVKNDDDHKQVILNVIEYINQNSTFSPLALDFSPIKGSKGNIEFLLYCRKNAEPALINVIDIVKKAHISNY